MSENLKYLIELIEKGEWVLHYGLVKYLMQSGSFVVMRDFGMLLAGMGLTSELINEWFHISRKE